MNTNKLYHIFGNSSFFPPMHYVNFFLPWESILVFRKNRQLDIMQCALTKLYNSCTAVPKCLELTSPKKVLGVKVKGKENIKKKKNAYSYDLEPLALSVFLSLSLSSSFFLSRNDVHISLSFVVTNSLSLSFLKKKKKSLKNNCT